MPSLLLHTCCAPCLVAPYRQLQSDFDTSIFFDNFNIHPLSEYIARRDSVRDFVKQASSSYIEIDKYGLYEFFISLDSSDYDRCYMCYFSRFLSTVKYAKAHSYDYFSTSLLYSRYQKHEMIRDICSQLSLEFGVKFLYQDFRELWWEGKKLARDMKLYRQKYCGCLFSLDG
jgi:hypothetical protein